jgi:predicted nucleic acid-binding protein
VAIVYFDSSAFVKLLVGEDDRAHAVALWDGCDAVVSARLAYPEVCAALAAAGRDHRLDEHGLRRSRRLWELFWSDVRVVDLTDAITRHAGGLAPRHALRGADSVHLASALTLRDADPVVAVWDRRLGEGAAAEGLRVVPAA